MANLTQHLNVVGTEQAGVHPQLGSYVVVLRQVGEGRMKHSVLLPNERPGLIQRVFNSADSLVSVPVTSNKNLRHEFTSSVEHVMPGHSFEADYILSFSVKDHETVAVRWIEDPVRKIEQEIRRVLDPAARAIEWNKLRDNIRDDGAARLCRDQVQNYIDDLREFASGYGIDIERIRMSLRLSRSDAQTDVEGVQTERHQISARLGAIRRRADVDAEYDVRKHEAEHRAELREMERPEELQDAGLEAMKKAMHNIADSTTRAEDLSRGAREVHSIFRPARALAGAERGALRAGAEPTNNNKVAEVLRELAILVDGLDAEPARRRELLSVLLHVTAEACRAKDAEDNDLVKKWEERAERLLAERDWGIEAFRELSKFACCDAMRERLK